MMCVSCVWRLVRVEISARRCVGGSVSALMVEGGEDESAMDVRGCTYGSKEVVKEVHQGGNEVEDEAEAEAKDEAILIN